MTKFLLFTLLALTVEYLLMAFCIYDIAWISHAGEWTPAIRALLALFAPLFTALAVCGLMSITSTYN